jgi:tetratricopeptide (TPR) repeat protein
MGTDNILSYHELLEASRKSGKNADYDNCLWCLEEANRINPNQTEVLWGLGTTYYFLKRFDEAEKYYKQLIQKEPENPKFNFEYGQLLLNKKDFPEGLKLIAKAMLAVPDYNYFFKNIGNIYFSAKMYKESIDAYEEYLKFFPLDKSAYQQLIIACTEGNEPEKLSDYSIKLKELTDSEKKDQE